MTLLTRIIITMHRIKRLRIHLFIYLFLFARFFRLFVRYIQLNIDDLEQKVKNGKLLITETCLSVSVSVWRV